LVVVVVVAVLALGGVITGVILAIKKNTHASGSASSSISGGSSGVTQKNPDDPSSFSKNPNFHQSFYGMAYTPIGGLPPDCGATLSRCWHCFGFYSLISSLFFRGRDL
jgi:hypothetical protein